MAMTEEEKLKVLKRVVIWGGVALVFAFIFTAGVVITKLAEVKTRVVKSITEDAPPEIIGCDPSGKEMTEIKLPTGAGEIVNSQLYGDRVMVHVRYKEMLGVSREQLYISDICTGKNIATVTLR